MRRLQKHLSITGRLLRTMILIGFGGVIALMILAYIFIDIDRSIDEIALVQSSNEIKTKNAIFNQFTRTHDNIIVPLARELGRLLEKHAALPPELLLEEREDFFNLIQINGQIMQLRYLDERGQEIIRVERDNPFGAVYFAKILQDKSHREYFSKTVQLAQGEVYHSSMDYNIEFKQISEIPVMRFAAPVYADGKIRGAVVVNVFVQALIEMLQQSEFFNVYIINHEGHFFHNLGNVSLLPRAQAAFTQGHAYHDDRYHLIRLKGISEQPNWLLLEFKEALITREAKHVGRYMFLTLVVFIVLFVPIALLLRESYLAIKISRDEVLQLNESLMQRVEEETANRLKNERMMIHQSRLAAMGEMIGAIAHQWRQPLNAINLTVYNIKDKFERGELDRTFFNTQYEKINGMVLRMSKTIDDFRNFFKPNKAKEAFSVNAMLEEALHLVGDSLTNSHIAYYFKRNEELQGYGFPNEYAQVLVNVIQNAKDALVDRSVKGAEIIFDLYAEGRFAVVTVRDNAGGVDNPYIQEKMFDPFFTTKEGNKGTGIGLYMAKKIIEDHMEGTITGSLLHQGERTPGENGMIFTIKIPRHNPKNEKDK